MIEELARAVCTVSTAGDVRADLRHRPGTGRRLLRKRCWASAKDATAFPLGQFQVEINRNRFGDGD